MSKPRVTALLVVPTLAILALTLGACRTGRIPARPVQPGTGVIPLAVWRVLAVNEIPGDGHNDGCRLTDAQVTAFITLLRNNAQTFGTGTAFAWDGQIFTIFDQSLPQRPFSDNLRTRLDSDWDDFDFTFWDQGYFETSAINIYFVGNVQPAPTQPGYNETLAFTLDPMGANSAGTPSFIVVNDGGMGSSFGPATIGGLALFPEVLVLNHVLEHEMAHFLGRFRNAQFSSPPPLRQYNMQEHLPVPPALNQFHLLRVGGIWSGLGPYTLFIAGSESDSPSISEKGQIYNRIQTGMWLSP